MDKPLKSVTHGQCDARRTVTFPAAGHHGPLAGSKLYCLVTEVRVRTTRPRLLPESGTAESRSATSVVERPNHYASHQTTPWL